MGHGTRLEPKVEVSPWLLFRQLFNKYTLKVGLNTKSVFYRLDLSVLKDLLKLICGHVCLHFFPSSISQILYG